VEVATQMAIGVDREEGEERRRDAGHLGAMRCDRLRHAVRSAIDP
jgi:hypothetical protein